MRKGTEKGNNERSYMKLYEIHKKLIKRGVAAVMAAALLLSDVSLVLANEGADDFSAQSTIISHNGLTETEGIEIFSEDGSTVSQNQPSPEGAEDSGENIGKEAGAEALEDSTGKEGAEGLEESAGKEAGAEAVEDSTGKKEEAEALEDSTGKEGAEGLEESTGKEEEIESSQESVTKGQKDTAVSDDSSGEETTEIPVGENIILTAEEREQKEKLEEQLSAISSLKEGKDYVKGEILVMAESEERAREYAEAFGGVLVEYFTPVAVILLPEKEENGLSVEEVVLASASQETNLPAAWPNFYRYPDEANDPFLSEGHPAYQWHHNAVGSKEAWEAGHTGDGIRVAVLDSGIGNNVEDLQVETVSGNLGTVDLDGHGTHVAGIVGAKLNNNIGGAGIAPDSQIISIKVINDEGAAESADIAQGIYQAIEAGADIINLSLGSATYSDVEQKAVTEAYQKGIAVICSSGNYNTTAVHYPSGYEGAIAVAALDKNMHRANFSNTGSHVRYSAPGVDIVSTIPEGYLKKISGTSQSAPIVSGIAAVLLSSGKVKGEGVDRLENLLTLMDQSCEKVTGTGLGKGNISLIKALNLNPIAASPNVPVVSHPAGTYKEEELKVSVEAAFGSEIYYTTNGKNITYKNGVISEGALKYDEEKRITISGKKSVTLKVMAVNPKNQMASKVVSVKYTLKPVASSVVIEPGNGNNFLAPGKSLTLKAVLLPDYTADKKVQWSVMEQGAPITVKNGKVTAAKDAKAGTYTVLVKAKGTDGGFTGAEGVFPIVIQDAASPITKITLTPKTPAVKAGEVTQVKAQIAKKDGSGGTVNELTWYCEDSTIATVTATDPDQLSIEGHKAGKTKLVGVANDGYGKKITVSLTVKQPVRQITLSGHDTLAIGKSITLKAALAPEGAVDKKLQWKIQPETSKVKVSNKGKVTASKGAQTGEYQITAVSEDGQVHSNVFIVNVVASPIKKLTLDAKSLTLFRKENKFNSLTSTQLAVKTEGGDSSEWTVESSDESLLTVSKDGNSVSMNTTGNGTGTVTVTVSTTDGSNLKKTCKIKIENPITGLALAPEKGRVAVISKGKKLKLTPVFETSFGSVSKAAKKLKWTSSNPRAVKVDSKGNVTALDGYNKEAIITAESTDGSNVRAEYKVSTCGVTVKAYLLDSSIDGWPNEKKTVKLNKGESKLYIVDHAYIVNWLKQGPVGSWEFEYKVNKPGLGIVVRWQDISGGSGEPVMVPFVYVVGNERGTYKLTISSVDGSSAKATYTFVVN